MYAPHFQLFGVFFASKGYPFKNIFDFNLPKVDWENIKPLPDCGHPTRGQNILDILYNKPYPRG